MTETGARRVVLAGTGYGRMGDDEQWCGHDDEQECCSMWPVKLLSAARSTTGSVAALTAAIPTVQETSRITVRSRLWSHPAP